MKERGILFSGPMVRALLAGTKSQTRRAAADRHFSAAFHARCPAVGVERALAAMWDDPAHVKRPYGRPGDQLWVRETWRPEWFVGERRIRYLAGGEGIAPEGVGAAFDELVSRRPAGRWRPSIHLPRWASRITLEVVAIRVERLNAITEADALAEGVGARSAYAMLWDEINGAGAWRANPWVWVVEFRRLP